MIVVAHRGVAQQFSRVGLGRQDCTATRIRPPKHPYLENTVDGIAQAYAMGADAVELDVQQSKDGRAMIFHDATLECRTDGRGGVARQTLAELKKLDVGYGYTADGGKTYPLRGRIGAMPTAEEVLQAVPGRRLVWHFKTRDPSDADALAAAFARVGAPIDERMAFYGPAATLDRMRRYAPRSRMWDNDRVKECGIGYLKWGWSGHVPDSCRGSTIGLPLNYAWAAWGWPNRFLGRMKGSDVEVILMGALVNSKAPAGLERPQELDDVPAGFSGYLWVEDIHAVGPALGRAISNPRHPR